MPTADPKVYTVANTAFSTGTPPGGFPAVTIGGTTTQWIPMSSPALTGGGSLSGSDPEDCNTASTCKAGRTFIVDSLYSNTVIYYDFGASGGIKKFSAHDTIKAFDSTKLVIYGKSGTGPSPDPVGFTYSLVDAAGKSSPRAVYQITTGTVLPIQLLRFEGRLEDCTVKLNIETGSETKVGRFAVQQSTDGEGIRMP